ncbi:MAG TPA: bifunctional riboflavin kinase/FAD synthetase [Usitatibacteraceae bacterium]|nr:bifunctional riboflavin kinase/FAD synthetase [Usitatibacteraceae bacterium]
MRLLRSLAAAHAHSGLALAIGNFDGVHLGHQAILADTVAAARQRGLKPAAMSFYPLPRELFAHRAGQELPVRLMSVTEKLAAFRHSGLDMAILAHFTPAFAGQSPMVFLDSLDQARVRWIMVGADFRFGAKRAGDIGWLRREGAARGIEVHAHSDVAIDRRRVSSTGVREALAGGALESAQRMLGRRYAMVGRVLRGRQLGRTLGFPTANVALSGRRAALTGVHAVQCRLIATRGLEGVAGKAGTILNGVANLGTNPVVSSENRQHLEVFLFDFSGDLYGRRLEVTFIEKIRDEVKFDGLEALVRAMHDDAERARTILRTIDDGHQD